MEGAILGKSCDIRSHVHIHDGAALGDGVTIGAQTVVMPDVRIFPHKEVESGAIVHESLVWEAATATHLFGREGVSGVVNVDLTPECGRPPGRGSRHRAPAERPCRGQPRRDGRVPDDQASDGVGHHVDGRQRRRPAGPAGARQPPSHPHAGLRRGLPRGPEPGRPGADRDSLLRASGHAAHAAAREGGREALHALRAAPGIARPDRHDRLSGSRAGELRNATCWRRSTRRRSRAGASGSSSTTATRRRRSSCRSCWAHSRWRRSRPTSSPTSTHGSGRAPSRSCRHAASSRRSAQTSGRSSTLRASVCI